MKLKNSKKVICLLAIGITLQGCEEKKEQTHHFTNVFKINYELFIGEELLQDPWNLLIMDSVLIVGNTNGEPLIEIYNLEGEFLTSFLTKGGGPEEILMIGGIQKSSNKNLLVYDLFGKKFQEYNLRAYADPVKPERTISYLQQLEDSVVLFMKLFITENYIVAESRSMEGRVALMKHDGSLVCYGGEYPSIIDERLSDYENSDMYASAVTVKRDASKVALAAYTAGTLDIFSIEDESIKPFWSYHEFLPDDLHFIEMGEVLRVAVTNNTRTGYKDIDSTDRFIYALFTGKKKDIKDYHYGNKIRIIDWDASITCELQTDIDLLEITVSEDDQYIYGIAKDENGEPCIVKFFIGDIMNNLI